MGWLGPVVSGILLQLSLPPSENGYLVYIFLVPTAFVLPDNRVRVWAFSGGAIGMISAAAMAFAFVGWGSLLTFLPWISVVFLFSFWFVASYHLQRLLALRLKWAALPVTWPVISTIGELAFGIPILFSMALAYDENSILAAVPFIGPLGIDVLILSCSTILASTMRQNLRGVAIFKHAFYQACLIYFLFIWEDVRTSDVRHFNVGIVQPGIDYEDLRASEWSLEKRLWRERLYDELTTEAFEGGADYVVWPEGGNGLYNTRLMRRTGVMEAMTLEYDAVLLASGRDLAPEGDSYNTVHHYEDGHLHSTARKSKLVPFAESSLSRGEPIVFATSQLRLGISICYESILSSHIAALKRMSAELIVVPTNDSSFGLASTEYWHGAVSLLRAWQHSVPILFVGNNGLSFFSPGASQISEFNVSSGEPEVLSWHISFPQNHYESSIRMRGILYLFLSALGLWFFFVFRIERIQ